MSSAISFAVGVVVVLLFASRKAVAWGPATHIYLAGEVLEHDAVAMPAPVRKCITKHSDEFVYGNVAADILYRHHSWSIGTEVLRQAKGAAQEAFAYGYNCHLAADVVAHNIFVPTQLLTTSTPKSLGHTYWEILADAHIRSDVWEKLNAVRNQNHGKLDALLDRTVIQAGLSYRTKKRIFDRTISVPPQHWTLRFVRYVSRRSKWKLDKHDLSRLHDESLHTMILCLDDIENVSHVLRSPTGGKLPRGSKITRRYIKRLARAGLGSEDAFKEVAATLFPLSK
jgi:hypothetical protein